MENDYNNIFEIKKKRKFSKNFFIFVVLLIIVTGVYLVCTHIILPSSNNHYDVYRSQDGYYAVVLGENDDYQKLEAMYGSVVALGASGYIWQGGDTSYIIALIYPTEDMAKSVVASNSIDMHIQKFETKQIAFNLDNFSPNEIDTIAQAINFVYDMGKVLYELTISIQLGGISTIAGASAVNTHKGQILANIATIQSYLNDKSSDNVNYYVAKMIKASNILEKLVNQLLTNQDESNAIKYCMCEYIYELCN